MKSGTIFRMEMPHREPMTIRGFVFGDELGMKACAVVGSTRGNEVQQAYICARLVADLEQLEREGAIAMGTCVLVIPCANPYAMNIMRRFWPADGTDINRMFPGNIQGETTERIAAGILHVVSAFAYGIQLCSFNQPGEFLPHVRITHQGIISDESASIAGQFGLPYVLHRNPTPFDVSTLNYAWQASGTHAFSVYSRATDRLDERSALEVERAMLRFMEDRGILASVPAEMAGTGGPSLLIGEEDMVDVRTERSAGFLVLKAHVGDYVTKGQVLGEVLDAFDAHVLETLVSPVDGRAFFIRDEPLVQQSMVILRIAPTRP